MSSEPPRLAGPPRLARPRRLADWIRALLAALDAAEPAAGAAIRRLAGASRAVIGLDAERAAVRFETGGFQAGRLVARRLPPAGGGAASGCAWGGTDGATVAALLGGHLEVSEAVASGRLDLRGSAAEVIAMCAILETLIDASTRVPELQRLAADYLAASEAAGAPADAPAARAARRARAAERAARETAFLRREGLG